MVISVFLGPCPFYLNFQIYWYKVVQLPILPNHGVPVSIKPSTLCSGVTPCPLVCGPGGGVFANTVQQPDSPQACLLDSQVQRPRHRGHRQVRTAARNSPRKFKGRPNSFPAWAPTDSSDVPLDDCGLGLARPAPTLQRVTCFSPHGSQAEQALWPQAAAATHVPLSSLS